MKYMKRIIFTLYVLASTLLSIQLKAQDTINIPKEKDLIVGVRTGISIFDMHYSSYDMSIYDHKNGVREQFGAFVEYPDLWQNLSVRFSMLYFTRGVNLNRYKINYSLRSHYLDFRFPISYTFLSDKKYQPYIVFAPNINFALGGKIQYNYEYTYYQTKLSKANFRPIDISLFLGAGVKTPIQIENKTIYVGGELGYNIGLCNTYSEMELNNQAHSINYPIYDVNGTRKNRGFEITLSVGWVIPNNIKASDIINKDDIKKYKDKISELFKKKPKTNNKIEYEAKDCYSLEEIQAFVTLNMPIDDKRICMFDLKFEFGSSILSKDSEKQLDSFVELFKKFPNMHIQINGHTDNVGSEEYNLKLSEERARSVYNYFINKGIAKDRMTIYGYGSEHPIESNDTSDGRAKNRRVEVDIQHITNNKQKK